MKANLIYNISKILLSIFVVMLCIEDMTTYEYPFDALTYYTTQITFLSCIFLILSVFNKKVFDYYLYIVVLSSIMLFIVPLMYAGGKSELFELFAHFILPIFLFLDCFIISRYLNIYEHKQYNYKKVYIIAIFPIYYIVFSFIYYFFFKRKPYSFINLGDLNIFLVILFFALLLLFFISITLLCMFISNKTNKYQDTLFINKIKYNNLSIGLLLIDITLLVILVLTTTIVVIRPSSYIEDNIHYFGYNEDYYILKEINSSECYSIKKVDFIISDFDCKFNNYSENYTYKIISNNISIFNITEDMFFDVDINTENIINVYIKDEILFLVYKEDKSYKYVKYDLINESYIYNFNSTYYNSYIIFPEEYNTYYKLINIDSDFKNITYRYLDKDTYEIIDDPIIDLNDVYREEDNIKYPLKIIYKDSNYKLTLDIYYYYINNKISINKYNNNSKVVIDNYDKSFIKLSDSNDVFYSSEIYGSYLSSINYHYNDSYILLVNALSSSIYRLDSDLKYSEYKLDFQSNNIIVLDDNNVLLIDLFRNLYSFKYNEYYDLYLYNMSEYSNKLLTRRFY